MTSQELLEALLALPEIEGAQVSPDGRWVSWSWFRAGPAADVFLAPTDGSAGPVRLTETPHDTLLASWTPDSRAVLVAQDRDGDERAQLFRVARERPGVMAPLTEAAPDYYLRGGQMHPNGRWLIYGANYDFAAGREIEPTWVYRHDLETGERVALARPQKPCYYAPKLNRPGTDLLYLRKELHPAGIQVWLADIEGKEDREILNVGADKKVRADWLPDGQRALVLAEAGSHQRVGIWDRRDGSLSWLLDDPDRWIDEVSAPANSRQVVVVESRQARVRPCLVDPGSGEERLVSIGGGSLLPLAPAAGENWVGLYYSSRQPHDLVRFELGDGRPERLVSLSRIWERTPLTPGDLAPAEDFRWRSVDGLEIQGWLYRPAGENRGAVITVHGGPTWHSQDWVNETVQFLVSCGFCVLDVNYRGSTGFSLAYREAIKEEGWGGREQQDIRTGIEALMAAGIARPGRVGITGTSFGGYASWYAITHLGPELVAASAPICGMTDLVVDYETTRPDLRPYSAEMMGGRPDQVPERYRERSPIHRVDRIRGKLLIVQGLQDPNVTPENVRLVRQALEGAEIPYELLTFEDEGHGIQKPKNLKVLLLRLAQFFEEAFGEG